MALFPTIKRLPASPWRLSAGLLLTVGLLAGAWLWAAPQPAKPGAANPAAPTAPPADAPRVIVELVSDFESNKLVSDLEDFRPVTETRFGRDGSQTVTLGEEAVLWVRNAHIDGKFFFERYYQGKYIGRRSQLDLALPELGPGEHRIEPGAHAFTVSAQGVPTSKDPEIRVQGNTVRLRLHRVTVYTVDGAKVGPAEFRKLAADVGLFALPPAFRLDPAKLPDPRTPSDPQKLDGKAAASPLTNLLSHQRKFYPLHVWLPANQVGAGYVLYPSWQAFHVRPDGAVDLAGSGSPAVAGVSAQASALVIPYRQFTGAITKGSRLTAGVAGEAIDVRGRQPLQLSATLEPLKFRAGIDKPSDEFFLRVDNDFSRRPFKSFVADNSTDEAAAIRLLALEWDAAVFARGQETTIGLRLLETPGKETLKAPEARVEYSPYNRSLPTYRLWQPVRVVDWQNDRERGALRFQVPDVAPGFCVFRVQVLERGARQLRSPLAAEIEAYVTDRGQKGTASVVSPKARNAFVAGENILLQLVLRSTEKRAAGPRTVVLQYPDGTQEKLAVQDPGAAWAVRPLLLKAEQTRNLPPGRYTLTVRDLPDGIAAAPFTFDLAGRDKPSPFLVVKPSKYTKSMNALETSHLEGEPVDLDRAMRTLGELGYTRIDLMTYVTNHHLRAYTWREDLAAADARLPAPESVFTPTPRDQILNACVREGLQYSDVWLTYNDFYLPRYIDPYIKASERWLAREVQAMRHSPAWDGIMLYDEMYAQAASGIVEMHINLFPRLRARLATEQLGKSPTQIEAAFSKYLQRPKDQRDPEALRNMLRYRDWEQHGWADYIGRVTAVGRSIAPAARFGTYHRTWLPPGTNDDAYNGYAPDVFKNLDIVSHVHYADNSTCWVSIPLLASALRQGNKPAYISMPLTHESRTEWDGQYQRHLAFAMLQQGVGGISQWGLPLTFDDEASPGTLQSRETTQHLNREILQPFGELLQRCADGYGRVGIVSTLNEHSLSQFKDIPVACQTEGLWIACWRLGYPATFLRETDFDRKLDGYSVIFVPGVRFAGELDEKIEKRLREAAAAGTRIVVEQGSILDFPGITRMDDEPLTSYFLGTYFPTWLDDELKKVYLKSQPIVDHLREKFVAWDVEPTARGPFKVGPTWRSAGDFQYLVVANFEDPDYGHAVKQQMAKPVQMELRVPGSRGTVAYDLLAGKELPLQAVADAKGRPERAVTVDMRRVQGGLVAFLPERPAKFQVQYSMSAAPASLRLHGRLIGASGKALTGLFPARITLGTGPAARVFHRVLGADPGVELDLPLGATAAPFAVTVREAVTGRTVNFTLALPARSGPVLTALAPETVNVPRPSEVKDFLAANRKVVVIPAPGIDGAVAVAQDLVKRLAAKGITAQVVEEPKAFHLPAGNPEQEDPLMDGFHSWRGGQEIIGPATVVDAPVILLGGRGSSFLVGTLLTYGFLTDAPAGGPGQAAPPDILVARKAFHFNYDVLCLLANDADGLRHAVTRLFEDMPATPALPALAYGAVASVESAESAAAPTAAAVCSNNEQVKDLQFDAAGNAYVITWGHGKNLYSLAPDGALRFSRFLPEMGANRLQVAADRLLVHTACGARLYQLKLDGQPISQARLNQDPGTTWDDEYELAATDFLYIPTRKQLLHNLGDGMRLIDPEMNIIAEWTGAEYTDKDVSDELLHRETGAYAVSPDGQRLAQIEISQYFTSHGTQKDVKVYDAHLVIRDFTGKLLAEFKNIENGIDLTARLAWPADAPGPIVYVLQDRLAFDAELKLTARLHVEPAAYVLADDRRLVRDGRMLTYYDGGEHVQSTIGPFEIMPTVVCQSNDRQWLATLDEYGAAGIFKATDGTRVASFQAPELGRVLRFSPDAQRLWLGSSRGTVSVFDREGHALATTHLAAANDVLGKPLPLVDPAFPDLTAKLWPVSRDLPGEMEGLVRLAEERIVNGDAETDGGWQGAVAFAAEGYQSKRSLQVGPATVSQEVSGYLGEHGTWVLEFFYRNPTPGQPARLLAGIHADNDAPDAITREWDAAGEWQFARLAMKSGRNCRKLTVGFSASGGDVRVDQVRFRRLRYPSINHMLYDPFFSIKPVLLDNPLFSSRYDPAGNVREQAPNRVMVEAVRTGSLNLIESVFLQNGRLNDTSSQWYVQPLGHDPVISMGLKEPRWVSMVGLYFNTREPQNVTPHFDIYATDMTTRKELLVARVRHNGQLFRLVKFAPVKTPMVRIKLITSIQRLRPLCEVELYGPLSGKEGAPGFLDADGQNTYMGDFSRVDKRHKPLAAKYGTPLMRNLGYGADTSWNIPNTQVLAGDGRLHMARAGGKNTAVPVANPMEDLYWGRAGGIGYAPYGALYGGLLLYSGLDGKAYCINPDSGNALWSTPLGTRLFGGVVAVGEDVFVANETGRVFQLDLANGNILREAPLTGGVYGCPATDGSALYVITDDGALCRVRRQDLGTAWKVPVAPSTDSTPAVDGGVVYLADQKGTAMAVSAADGKVLWRTELQDEFARCPVVAPSHIIFGCRGGTLAVLNRADGKLLWSRRVPSRFYYEPVLFDDQRFLYFRGGSATLAALADGKETALQSYGWPGPRDKEDKPANFEPGEPSMPLTYYKGTLVVPVRDDHEGRQINYAWHPAGGRIFVLAPWAEKGERK